MEMLRHGPIGVSFDDKVKMTSLIYAAVSDTAGKSGYLNLPSSLTGVYGRKTGLWAISEEGLDRSGACYLFHLRPLVFGENSG